jgi:hypothetical protein
MDHGLDTSDLKRFRSEVFIVELRKLTGGHVLARGEHGSIAAQSNFGKRDDPQVWKRFGADLL